MRERFLADWICYTAERDVWWVTLRPWKTRDKTWIEWHEERFAATREQQELIRAARHRAELSQ